MPDACACTRAHSAVTIRETGDVFFCGHGSPLIGNIRQAPLPEILGSEEVATLRELNSTGKLSCQATCLHAHHFVPVSTLTPAQLLLDDLLLMVALDCNIACTMCYQAKKRKRFTYQTDRRLSPELLIRQVPFQRIKRVVIQGGEPTVIPEVLALLQHLNAQPRGNPSVNLVTNGLLLPDSVVECIRSRAEFVYISLNGATAETHQRVNRGSNWNVVLGNIALLRQLRSTHGGQFKIVGGFTIVPRNIREVPRFIEIFDTLGFDSISFNYDPSTLRFLEREPEAAATLRAQLRAALAPGSGRGVRVAKLLELGLIS